MKKIGITILALLAVQSQAVTFSWASSAQVKFGDDLVSALSPSSYTATLVYLGSDASWGTTTITPSSLVFTTDGTKTDKATGDTTTSVSGKTGIQARNNSRFTGSFQHTLGTETSGGYTVTAGDTFGVFLTYTDADGKTWFNVSSDTYTLPADATDITQNLSGTFAFSASKTELAEGAVMTAGSGWARATPVPEPGTASLALAGLALLLKRRRA